MLKEDEKNIRRLKEKKLRNDRMKTRGQDRTETEQPQYTTTYVVDFIKDRVRSKKKKNKKQIDVGTRRVTFAAAAASQPRGKTQR